MKTRGHKTKLRGNKYVTLGVKCSENIWDLTLKSLFLVQFWQLPELSTYLLTGVLGEGEGTPKISNRFVQIQRVTTEASGVNSHPNLHPRIAPPLTTLHSTVQLCMRRRNISLEVKLKCFYFFSRLVERCTSVTLTLNSIRQLFISWPTFSVLCLPLCLECYNGRWFHSGQAWRVVLGDVNRTV